MKTVLDQTQAWNRSYELVANDELGNHFRLLSNTAYMAVEWLEYSESNRLTNPLLAKKVANDLECAIKASLRSYRPFDRAVAQAIPDIKKRAEKCVKACVRSDRLLDTPYYLRVRLAVNTIDVVGRHLEL